jgi:hypothetical protein
LLACITANGCDQVCPDQLDDCGLEHCLAELGALPPSCLTCVQSNIGNTLDDILTTCESPAIEYAYGSSFGIGLSSAYPFAQQEIKVFESTINRRAAIYASIETPVGQVHAFCTHLTAVFVDIPWPKPTGSWEEEQATQIDQLVAWANEKAGSEGRISLVSRALTSPSPITSARSAATIRSSRAAATTRIRW